MTFAFQNEVPSREAFDAMNDAAFCDWWDAFEERVFETEGNTDGMVEFAAARATAETERGW